MREDMKRDDDVTLPPLAAKWGASVENWQDAAWQMRHACCTLEDLERVLELSPRERAALQQAGARLAVRVTPHFLSLIDPEDVADPLRRQVIPLPEELESYSEELFDPCGEQKDEKAPGLVHRYPDRVLLLCTDRCATYCRYCTRARLVSGKGRERWRLDWEGALKYLREHTEVRDVLLSGGDPLLLADEKLDAMLGELRRIPHIEFLRIGTRVPIMLPQRITPALCAMLRRHAPLFISIHCNHPHELGEDAERALGMLADSGIPLGNQSVLLRGVNDSVEVQRALVHRLLQCRVRPYYLYQCDPVVGTRHFRTRPQEGIDIISALRGFTSGYAVPQFVIDAPGGGGKVPLNPNYVVAEESGRILLRNFLGDIYEYPVTPQV